IFNVDYLGGNMPTFALNFSRPGGQIICQYYNFLRLGREGYTKLQQACSDVGAFIADEVAKIGLFDILYDGGGCVPGAPWKLKDSLNTGYTLFDLSDRLRSRGWQVAAYALPANNRSIVVQRVLVRHGVSMDLGKLLVDDINRCIAWFKQHPVRKPLLSGEGT